MWSLFLTIPRGDPEDRDARAGRRVEFRNSPAAPMIVLGLNNPSHSEDTWEGCSLHPTRTELVALGELDRLGERARHGIPLEVGGNRVWSENLAIPDPDHTQEVRGSSPLAPTPSRTLDSPM